MKYCCPGKDILDHGYEMPSIIGENKLQKLEDALVEQMLTAAD